MNRPCISLSCLLVLASTALNLQSASAQTTFGSAPIGSTQSAMVTVQIPEGGTLETIAALTAGVSNLDFNTAPGGSCTIGAVYANQSSCTVKVTFQPKFPGNREGGVVLEFTSNNGIPGQNSFASYYLRGSGLGPRASFGPQAPATLASLPNLVGVTADNRGGVFLVAGAINDSFPGGSTPIANGYWSHTSSFSMSSTLPTQEPAAISVDGIGNFTVPDLEGITAAYAPQPGNTYVLNPYTFDSPSGSVDGAGNSYSLPGPIKQVHQQDGSLATTSIGNLQDATGIAVDASGVVYVASQQLYKLTPEKNGTYTQSVVPLPLTSIAKVGIDGIGNLYLTDATGLFKETIQSNGSYVQTPIKIGSLPLAQTQIADVDLLGNVFLQTLTDKPYYQDFYSNVSQLDYAKPLPLAFKPTAIDAASSAQTITITNSGNQPLKVSAITFPADFSEATPTGVACAAGSSLAQGASCTLAIQFTPVAAGTPGSSTRLSESVLITTNTLDKVTEQAIQVSGTEIIPATAHQVTLKLSASTIEFGGNTTAMVSLAPGVMAPTIAPTGTIKLTLDGKTVLETLTLSGSGHGTAAAYGNFSGVSAGVHNLTAVYSGDSKNPPSSSAPVAYTVTPARVTLSLACPSTVDLGSKETCQVFTTPIKAGAPGVITYQEDALPSVSVDLKDGTATITPQAVATAGPHQIKVSYAAQGNYQAAKPVVASFNVVAPQ